MYSGKAHVEDFPPDGKRFTKVISASLCQQDIRIHKNLVSVHHHRIGCPGTKRSPYGLCEQCAGPLKEIPCCHHGDSPSSPRRGVTLPPLFAKIADAFLHALSAQPGSPPPNYEYVRISYRYNSATIHIVNPELFFIGNPKPRNPWPRAPPRPQPRATQGDYPASTTGLNPNTHPFDKPRRSARAGWPHQDPASSQSPPGTCARLSGGRIHFPCICRSTQRPTSNPVHTPARVKCLAIWVSVKGVGLAARRVRRTRSCSGRVLGHG